MLIFQVLADRKDCISLVLLHLSVVRTKFVFPVCSEFSGDLRPPPATLTMVAGGGNRIGCLIGLFGLVGLRKDHIIL